MSLAYFLQLYYLNNFIQGNIKNISKKYLNNLISSNFSIIEHSINFVKGNNENIVKIFNIFYNSKKDDIEYLFQLAIIQQNIPLIKAIIKKNINFDIFDIYVGNLPKQKLYKLIEKCNNYNEIETLFIQILPELIEYEYQYKKIIKFILKFKLNIKDILNFDKFHFITDLETIQLLINSGIDVNAKSKYNYENTYIFYVFNDIPLAKLLIDNGANINITNKEGETPLHCIKNSEMAQFLIDNGADINIRSIYGTTPLHHAHNVQIAKILIDNGADVNAKNNYNRTPLHFTHNIEIAQLLINSGSDINAKDDKNETPLHNKSYDSSIFVYDSKIDFIKLLIDNGADVNIKNKYNMTAMQLTSDNKIKELLNSKNNIYKKFFNWFSKTIFNESI